MYIMNNLRHFFTGLAILALGLGANAALAQDLPENQTFPIRTPEAPKAKTQHLRFSILEQGVAGNPTTNWMVRFDYRNLLAESCDPQRGWVLGRWFNHLFATTPAVMERFTQPSGYPSTSEIALGVGYRFPFANFAVIPQAHFRDIFAIAPDVHQHLIGFEPGVRLEYWLYPEVTRLAVDYGFNVPFVHLANNPSNVSPFTLSLNRVNLEISYRLLPSLDVITGFQWWQVPSQLGTGGIDKTTTSGIFGFQVGLGGAF